MKLKIIAILLLFSDSNIIYYKPKIIAISNKK